MKRQLRSGIHVGVGAGGLGDGEMGCSVGTVAGGYDESERRRSCFAEGSSEPCYEAEMVVVGRPSQPLGCRWRWMAVGDGATVKEVAADDSEQ